MKYHGMQNFASRASFTTILAFLALASLVLGGCIDGNSCDIIPDGAFGKGWAAFSENWSVQMKAADDVTILSKIPESVIQKHGGKCALEKPILKLSAPAAGISTIETKKIAIPKAGSILLNFAALTYEGNTKGSIRFETLAAKLIWEVQFSAIEPGAWKTNSFSYTPLAGENFIVVKAIIDSKASATVSSIYFSNIKACLADTTLVKRDLLTSDVRHKGWATCGGAQYSSSNEGAGISIPSSSNVGYLRFPGSGSESSVSRKFQAVVGVSYLVKAYIGLPENEKAVKVYINDIEQELQWEKDSKNVGSLTLIHTSVRPEFFLTIAKLNGLVASKSDVVLHQLSMTAINCFAPKFLA